MVFAFAHESTSIYCSYVFNCVFQFNKYFFLDWKINGEISGESGPKINRKEDQSHTLHMRRQVHPMVWSGLLSAVQFHWCSMRACLFVYIYLYKSLKSPEIGIHKTINGRVWISVSLLPIPYRIEVALCGSRCEMRCDASKETRRYLKNSADHAHKHSYLTLIWEYLTGQGMFQHQINVSI